MKPDAISNSQARLNNFINEVSRREAEAEREATFKNSKSYKFACIADAKAEGLENCAAGVVSKIYADALPIADEYKAAHRDTIGQPILSHIREKNPKGVFAYITDCAKGGCKPAKAILEAVTEEITNITNQFYVEAETDEYMEPEKIHLRENDNTVIKAIDDITAKMDSSEISSAIENNVQATIEREVAATREEDQKLKDLESRLSSNEEVTTEAALEMEAAKNGVRLGKSYKPSLFTSIMLNKTKLIEESTADTGLDSEHVDKKAFIESVKEYAMLETLHTLGFEELKGADIDRLATRYAYPV